MIFDEIYDHDSDDKVFLNLLQHEVLQKIFSIFRIHVKLIKFSLIGARVYNMYNNLTFKNMKFLKVYGAGGNSGANLKNDFIEIFNGGASEVDVSGWSVQYASSSGNNWYIFKNIQF